MRSRAQYVLGYILMAFHSNNSNYKPVDSVMPCSPAPTVDWVKKDGMLPLGRHLKENFNTELTIWKVQQSDEGDYICKSSNTKGSNSVVLQVNVQGNIELK